MSTVQKSSPNVDYRPLTSVPPAATPAMHVACWDVLRRESRERGVTVEYVPGGIRSLPVELAWKSVTCAVCGDTFTLTGYGLAASEVVAVRQALLCAVVHPAFLVAAAHGASGA